MWWNEPRMRRAGRNMPRWSWKMTYDIRFLSKGWNTHANIERREWENKRPSSVPHCYGSFVASYVTSATICWLRTQMLSMVNSDHRRNDNRSVAAKEIGSRDSILSFNSLDLIDRAECESLCSVCRDWLDRKLLPVWVLSIAQFILRNSGNGRIKFLWKTRSEPPSPIISLISIYSFIEKQNIRSVHQFAERNRSLVLVGALKNGGCHLRSYRARLFDGRTDDP
jgi:hypothetical protein